MEQYAFMTVDDILTPAMSEAINNSSSQLTAVQDTQMIAFVQWLNDEFLRSSYTDIDAQGLSFMKKSSPLFTYKSTTLSSSPVAGAPTFGLTNVTGWPTSGRVVVQTTKGALIFLDYSALAANVATVDVNALYNAIPAGLVKGYKVALLYALPSDYAKMMALRINSYPPFEQSNFYGFPVFGEYLELDNYLLLPYNLPNSDLTLWYQKTGKTITARTGNGSQTNIPFKASRYAISMTLFHLYQIRRKRQDLKTEAELAKEYLNDFLQYDAAQSTSTLMRFE